MRMYRNTKAASIQKGTPDSLARLALDRNGREPLYRQIATYLQAEIRAGRLAPGTRLPSTRKMATALRVNLVTAVSAYRELIRLGLATGQVGRGTFVSLDIRGLDNLSAAGPPVPEADPVASLPAGRRRYPATIRRATPHAPAPSPGAQIAELGARWDPLATPQSRATPFPKPLGKSVIALNNGLPSADFFPMAAFRQAMETVLRREGNAALQYQPREGFGPLREVAAGFLTQRGTRVQTEDLLICSGGVTGVHIAAHFLTRPGDVVLTENPTYCVCLSALESLGVKLVGVPVDQDGMRVDIAERLVRQYRPTAIYTLPTYNNPTGVSLSLERRQALLALALREGISIIEEDYGNEIGFTRHPSSTLKALDATGQVIYVKSFSKLIFPSIRVAILAAPAPMIRGLLVVKEGVDPYTSGLNQQLLHELILQPGFARYVEGLPGKYRPRHDAMCRALRELAGRDLAWLRPEGGLHVWVRLPAGLDSQDLLAEAIEAGVAFLPGHCFVPDRAGGEFMRLSFGNVKPEEIRAGVLRLMKVVRRNLGRQRRRRSEEPVSAGIVM